MLEFKTKYLEHILLEKKYSLHTYHAYESDLNEFELFLNENALVWSEIDHKTIRFFMTQLLVKSNTRRTIARKLSALKGYFRFLIHLDIRKDNPLDLLDKQKFKRTLPEYLSFQEVKELVSIEISNDKSINLRNQVIIHILYASGIRVSELVNLEVGDLDFANYLLKIKAGKGGKDRLALVNARTIEIIKNYLEQARIELLSRCKTPTLKLLLNARGQKITARGVELIVKEMGSNLAQPKAIYPHMLRHSFATHLVDNGADLRSIQELLGHKNLNATQIYTHISTKKIREVYTKSQPRNKS